MINHYHCIVCGKILLNEPGVTWIEVSEGNLFLDTDRIGILIRFCTGKCESIINRRVY